MRVLRRTWFTIDTDDVRHVPSNQGHPTRSKPDETLPMISQQFRSGMKGLTSWLQRHEHPITMFVIADQCESEEFVQMMNDLCSTFGDRITIGCHGLHHRSWSAWPEDREAFAQDLETSVTILKQHFPQHFRPWFRAPAGYIASWMIPVLVEQGFTVDSSINPSWLVIENMARANHGNLSKQQFMQHRWSNVHGKPVFHYQLADLPNTLWGFVGMPKERGND